LNLFSSNFFGEGVKVKEGFVERPGRMFVKIRSQAGWALRI
jgi:hypothetical protein